MNPVFALLGLIGLAAPGRLIALGERLAFENPGEATLRSWIPPVARAEGIGWLLFALRGGRSNSMVGAMFGLAGVPMILLPKRVVDGAMWIAYTRSDEIELRSWVVPVTRVLGIVYVFTALRTFRGRKSATDADAQ